MSDYPDPDEEYEMMYSDELEMLREIDDTDTHPVKKKGLSAKRSLDFSSSIQKTITVESTNGSHQDKSSNISQDLLTPSLQALDHVLTPANASNKRSAEDLFGDINDIDFDIELPSKRQKTEEESDLELMNKIIECRRLKQMLLQPNKSLINNKSNYNIKENISYNIPRWSFIPLTNSDGERFYVKLESEENWEESIDLTSYQLTLNESFISVWEEARKILEEKQQIVTDELTQHENNPNIAEINADLWVEKYRPKSYLDLLSEEPVNRALLHWLHLWDKVVFKKEVKTKEPHQRNTFSKRTGQFQMSNSWRGKQDSEPELAEDGRPHHKLALLCGPPGAGKTTLAHLLARLAGYRPVEINASDERSTESFQTALQSATQMRSVLDAERRPNCLILDEIDGAPIQTVELLVKWCTATKKDEGKKKSKSQPLKRPVIAICNDLYASSLRPLRPVSLIVTVGSVAAARLTARLSAVAKAERLCVSARALPALVARAGGDIRTALHVLGFLKAKAKSQVNIEDIEKASVGSKDHTKSMMQALKAIFTIEAELSTILKTIQAAGEYDRLADGIFENYLSARVDSKLLIARETTSWLLIFDVIQTWIHRNQNYSMYGMLPMALARCHSVLAVKQPQRIKFPMQAQEVNRRKAEMDSIVWSVWRGSEARVVTTRRALSLDLLPLLPHLLSPALRSGNVQLCSEAERASLRACAGAMCDYGVQYVQQRAPDGLYAFQLEPDINKVAFFGTEERGRPLPHIRQAIAREQQMEVIRRSEEMMSRMSKKNKNEVKEKTKIPEMVPESDKRLPNHLQRLQPKAVVKNTPQVHKDFFGRIVPTAQIHKQDGLSDVITSSNVFYQYREGFNNAVRRSVRFRDLL